MSRTTMPVRFNKARVPTRLLEEEFEQEDEEMSRLKRDLMLAEGRLARSMRVLEQYSLLDTIHITKNMRKWWAGRKAADAALVEQQAREKAVQIKKEKILAKLTDEERTLLGLPVSANKA